MTELETIKLVHQSLDVGINFFDTAPNFGHGTGDKRFGKALKSQDCSKIVALILFIPVFAMKFTAKVIWPLFESPFAKS